MLKSRCIIAKAGAYKKGDYVLLNKEYWVVRSWMTVGDVVEYLCEATGELAKGESDAEEPMTTISLHNEIKALQALCQSTHESVEVLTELVAAASNKRSNGIWELEKSLMRILRAVELPPLPPPRSPWKRFWQWMTRAV